MIKTPLAFCLSLDQDVTTRTHGIRNSVIHLWLGLIHLVIASLGHPACPSPTPSSFGTACFHPAAFLSHIIHLRNFLWLNRQQSWLIGASIAGLPNITIQSSLDGLLHFLFHKHHIAISIVSSTNQCTFPLLQYPINYSSFLQHGRSASIARSYALQFFRLRVSTNLIQSSSFSILISCLLVDCTLDKCLCAIY